MWTPDWSMQFSSSRVESRPRGGTRYLDVKLPCWKAGFQPREGLTKVVYSVEPFESGIRT
ncbi:hypothetical protein E5345_04990 [Propionibacterium sp. NM47_B9-13]|nr:hypothetical protein CP877_03140 [Cutibacterium modestum]TGY29368.1 hypothetical protein E5345_04990 [Propionibacterium sp. NM47_B9-13]